MPRERQRNGGGFGDLIGQSAPMQRLYRMIARVAGGRHPVLLLGENGAGKSAVARAIHAVGMFPERPFIELDCTTAGDSLADGDWFRSKDGSPAGTLFLREIWALPPLVQAKLVRILQEREIRAIDDKAASAEARIIGGSTRDLELAVQQSTFRRDLYVRLNVVSLQVPALRDRKEDVGPLAEHFLGRIAASKGVRYSFSAEAAKALMGHDWPGNVGELQECLECAVTACSSPVLGVEDLPLRQLSEDALGEIGLADNRILPLAEVEKQTILRALERLNGDKVTAARMLGIGKTTLYRKLKEYGISEPWISRPATNR